MTSNFCRINFIDDWSSSSLLKHFSICKLIAKARCYSCIFMHTIIIMPLWKEFLFNETREQSTKLNALRILPVMKTHKNMFLSIALLVTCKLKISKLSLTDQTIKWQVNEWKSSRTLKNAARHWKLDYTYVYSQINDKNYEDDEIERRILRKFKKQLFRSFSIYNRKL